MLPELAEAHATGTIATIYAEIREVSGVPYVSSLQRYLATLPGVLEWAWAALRPAIVNWRTTEADIDLFVDVVRELAARAAAEAGV